MLSEDDIYHLLETVMTACAGLPERPLSAGERMARGGSRFREGPALVRLVSRLLHDRPELYADVPVAPAALRARLDRSLALGRLATGLGILSRRAADLSLLDESGAVTDALAAVRQVRSDAERPFPPPEAAERADSFAAAEELLAARHARTRTGRQKKAKAERTPADLGTPQRRAMTALRRERLGERLDRAREDLTAPPPRPPGR